MWGRFPLSLVFLLSFGLPLVSVRVFYRRPPGPPSTEPVRIQFTTDPEACESDGWQLLAPANAEDELCNPFVNSVDERVDCPAADSAHVVEAPAVAPGSLPTAPVDVEPSAASSSSELPNSAMSVASLAIVPYEGSALDLVASGEARVGRPDWTPVNEYQRKIVKEEAETLRAGARRIIADEGWKAGTPASSGKFALIATCNNCGPDCSKKWRFSFLNRRKILVQETGAHGDRSAPMPSSVIRRQHRRFARGYAEHTHLKKRSTTWRPLAP